MLKRLIFALMILVAAIYLLDVAVFTVRKGPTGVVTVHPYTAVQRNDKREELMFDPPDDESCVDALLPHQHLSPCWYLRRHTQRRNNL